MYLLNVVVRTATSCAQVDGAVQAEVAACGCSIAALRRIARGAGIGQKVPGAPNGRGTAIVMDERWRCGSRKHCHSRLGWIRGQACLAGRLGHYLHRLAAPQEQAGMTPLKARVRLAEPDHTMFFLGIE